MDKKTEMGNTSLNSSTRTKNFLTLNLDTKSKIELHFESTTWERLAILNKEGKIIWLHELPEAPNIANSAKTKLPAGKYNLHWFSDSKKSINIFANMAKGK